MPKPLQSSDLPKKQSRLPLVLIFLVGIIVGAIVFYAIDRALFSGAASQTETNDTLAHNGAATQEGRVQKNTSSGEHSASEDAKHTTASDTFPAPPRPEPIPINIGVADTPDTLVRTIEAAPNPVEAAPASSANREEYVATDEMLTERYITVQIPQKRNTSLDSTLINDKTPPAESRLHVEFWRSPINYTGYKFRKNKLVLFGFYEPDSIQVRYQENKLALFYKGNVFLLEETENFRPLQLKRKKL